MKTKQLFFSLLFLLTVLPTYAQNTKFDALANEINRISLYKKTKSLELLDLLYQMAYNSSNNSLLIDRCLYEESLLNLRQGITDTLLAGRIKTRLARENLSLQEQALLQLSLGTELQNTGEYSEAFTIYLQALEKYRQLNNNRFIAITLNSLGHICSSISLLSLEEYYYSEAIESITPEYDEYISIKANLFRIKTNEDESAIDSMLYLIEIAEKENREELLPAFYLNIGSYFFSSNPEKAFQYFTKVQNLDFDSPKILATLYANMAAFYCYQSDISKGLLYFKNAQKIIEETNNLSDLAIVCNNISILFEIQNMPDSALVYVRKNQKLTEKLRSNTVAIETHQQIITSTLEASKNKLIIAEQQITLKNRQFAIIVIVSVSAILSILLLLLFVHQQKRRKASENRELEAKLEYEKLEKEKQEEIIDAKTRELASFSMLVSNKNQLLKQISGQIEQMFNNKENAIHIASKTDEIIRNNLNIDEEWASFKMHFDQVHPHFFEKLKHLCGDLTEENLRMCAYFKIGMTTKQLAQLLHIIPRSVIINRYRLKKKLQLSDSENLDDFIRNL